MSESEEKIKHELSMFCEFVQRTKLATVSIEKCFSPQPDILCKLCPDNYIAFKIREICSEVLAKNLSDHYKGREDAPIFTRPQNPVHKLVVEARKNISKLRIQAPYRIALLHL